MSVLTLFDFLFELSRCKTCLWYKMYFNYRTVLVRRHQASRMRRTASQFTDRRLRELRRSVHRWLRLPDRGRSVRAAAATDHPTISAILAHGDFITPERGTLIHFTNIPNRSGKFAAFRQLFEGDRECSLVFGHDRMCSSRYSVLLGRRVRIDCWYVYELVF